MLPLMKARILIADDHDIVRQGLKLLIDAVPGWTVCGEAKEGRAAVTMAGELQPDVVVMDYAMPGLNGVDATLQIKAAAPKAEVIVFSGTENDRLMHSVFEAGARSFISKVEASKHLVAAIETVLQHKPYFTERVSEVIFARYLQQDRFKTAAPEPQSRLTAREREIVQLLAEGRTNKEIADTLSISTRTAETHRSALMRKLNLRNTAEVVRFAIRNQIIEP
jgi:DNA-binding NarL/FixJ family response regulator